MPTEKTKEEEKEASETIICPNCGAEVSVWQKKCPNCNFCLSCSA